MRDFLKQAEKITGKNNLFQDEASKLCACARPDFSGGAIGDSRPVAIARPANLEQAAQLVELCSQTKIAIRIRGGGSALLPPKNPAAPWIVLLTTGLDRILEINTEDRLVTVQAGVTCDSLAKALAPKGLFFPANPFSFQTATLGGCLAMNAAGPNSLKYGPASAWLHSLEVLTPSGNRTVCAGQNGQPGKLAPAFPLAPLFCGSAGCLGIIGQATLRAAKIPERRQMLLASFADLVQASQVVSALAARQPDLLEVLDKNSVSAMYGGESDHALLLIEFCGSDDTVAKDMTAARDILADGQVSGILPVDNPDEIMRRRASLPMAFSPQPFLLCSIGCLPSRIPGLVEGIEQIAVANQLKTAIFGHAGVARLHVAMFYSQLESALQAQKELFTLELVLNKALESEREINMGRRQWQENHDHITRMTKEIRQLFDPAGLFAPAPLPGQGEIC